MADGFIILI